MIVDLLIKDLNPKMLYSEEELKLAIEISFLEGRRDSKIFQKIEEFKEIFSYSVNWENTDEYVKKLLKNWRKEKLEKLK